MESKTLTARLPINGRSHVRGPTDIPLLDLTIPQLLARAVEKESDKEALVFCEQGIRRTYKQFSTDVDSFASGLLALGFNSGDRIGVWSLNRYEWLLAQFSTARLGIILVTINPAYRVYELEFALNKVGCSGLILSKGFKSSDYIGMLLSLAPELAYLTSESVVLEKLPSLKRVICMDEINYPSILSFWELLKSEPNTKELDFITDSLLPDDPINIQFTSGTTGLPKGATLTHKNIVNNAFFVMEAMEFISDDKLCIPVPFYHCFGMVMGTLGCVSKAATMVVPGEGFEPQKTLRAVSEERCTALYGVATMFVAVLEYPQFTLFDISSLRTGIMAGGPCPVELMRDVQFRMHMKGITIAYGMTETSPVSFQSNIRDPIERRVTSVGRVHPHVEVKIVDHSGDAVEVDVSGELWTKGYSLMKEYWEDSQRTDETIDSDGWLHTGDLGSMDSEGYVNITGRLKDMIIRGGENIYPRELEDFLYTHPSISQAQVFGLPDKILGEVVCVWVVAKRDVRLKKEDINNFCKENIAHFKIPKYVKIVKELPMTVTGKPQKFLMRKAMIEELGLKEISTA
ncbi:MAG: fatty-acyl-CoA synthase [Paracoccaceae bacterium]|jgi:fatty-acyl-CoA synthase